MPKRKQASVAEDMVPDSVRFSAAELRLATRLIERQGIGVRAEVLRRAAIYGLDAFLSDPSLWFAEPAGDDGALQRTSLRLPAKAVEASKRVVELVGMGDRCTVIRRAAAYGLRAFTKRPAAMKEARVIELKVNGKRGKK